MKITKTITKSYEVYEALNVPFGKYGEIMNARVKTFHKNAEKGLSKCFICNHKFDSYENVYIGFVRKHKNVFLCDDCMKEVNEND